MVRSSAAASTRYNTLPAISIPPVVKGENPNPNIAELAVAEIFKWRLLEVSGP